MMDAWIIAKATLVFGVSLAAVAVLHERSASFRTLVLTAGFLIALTLPIAAWLMPVVAVPWPTAIQSDPTGPSLDARAVQRVLDIRFAPAEVDGPSARPISGRATTWAAAMRAVWLTCSLTMLVSLGVSLWHAAGVRRRARRWEPSGDDAGEWSSDDALTRVDVRVSDEIRMPMAFGLLRPVVLLPPDAEGWSTADRTHALVHELEHVRRRDVAVIAMARATCALYWFHPLAWVAWRRLRLDMERACDDAVVVSGDRVAYAEMLMQMARRQGGDVAMTAMASKTDLSARVMAVLDSRRARGRVRLRSAGLALAVSCLVAVFMAPLRISAAQGGAEPELQPRPAPVKGGGSVTGVVHDPTGAPLGGLLLLFESNCFGPGARECGYWTWTRTDRFGRYRVEGLPPWHFSVVSPIDFFPGTTFNIERGQTLVQDITMKVEPVVSEFTICAECAALIVPDSLAKEFEADRKDSLDHPVSAPRPSTGWEYYSPGRGLYPPELRDAALEGSVVVEGTISTDGVLTGMRASPAGTPLATATLAALAEEVWEPGRVRGVAIDVPFRFLIRYTLKP
ncbi:MAG: M56 family metallopeptidase [Vicinamibacterales bacterium]